MSMLKIFSTVTSYFTSDSNKKLGVLEIEQAKEVLNKPDEDEPPQENPDEEKLKNHECFKRTAKVTFIDNHCITLEGDLYFDNCTVQGLEVGDIVVYLGYMVNDEIKISKILEKLDDEWSNPVEEKANWYEKLIIVKVAARDERKIHIQPGDFILDLNKIRAEFVPMIGDWLQVQAIIEKDVTTVGLGGNILDITAINPVSPRMLVGIVKKWNDSIGIGIINNDIYFSKDACCPGYIPEVGDRVSAQAVESDQLNLHWRAINVVPEEETTTTIGLDKMPQDPRIIELLKNKNGIEISDDIQINFKQIGEAKIITVNIFNKSEEIQKIIKGYFKNQNKDESQIRLHSPPLNDGYLMEPEDKLIVKFSCRARHMGTTKELFVFMFEGFEIARWITIQVIGEFELRNRNSFIPPKNKKEVFRNAKSAILNTQPNDILLGQKPVRPPSFITNKLPMFDIPMWLIDNLFSEMSRYQYIGEIPIERVAPCLSQNLSIQTYADRFHCLVYLEELSLQINMHKYDMKSATFIKDGEFLLLEVEDLSERRPSVILGDKVMAYKPNHKLKHVKLEGFVHKTAARHVFLKFHQNFHDSYNGEEYTIEFQSSRTNFRRYHQAIDLAIRNLGQNFLFPNHVKLKEPQILFQVDDGSQTHKSAKYLEMIQYAKKRKSKSPESPESKSKPDAETQNEEESSSNASISSKSSKTESSKSEPESPNASKPANLKSPQADLSTKSEKSKNKPMKILKWFDKKLNMYQRRAVENILRGEARPLPYFIFGPPGTGKTVTLIETILQICALAPHCHILVVAPSNSAADLIAHRVLDANILQPGEMVRMIAFRCIADNNQLSERLAPYYVTGDISREGSRESRESYLANDGKKIRIGMQASTLGRHKVTIGTCMVIGNIYTMGLPKGHFTHILIDEAGQATEPEVLIPLCMLDIKTAQTVLAGDPLQLGPCVFSRLSEAHGLSESFFERLIHRFPYVRDPVGFPETGGYDPRLVTRLVYNYRSLPEILSLPNKLFYNSELQATISPEQSDHADILRRLQNLLPRRQDQLPPALIFHGVRGENFQTPDSPSWFNLSEAAQVFYYVTDIMAEGISYKDIGIITPYIKQGQQVRALFDEAQLKIPKIGSVEEFQGQEFKIIVLTTVRSNEAGAKSDTKYGLGFMASPRRLNVAITRAEALLIVVGNPHLLVTDNYWRSVLTYSISIGGYRGCDLPSSLLRSTTLVNNN